jgi:hypothetical protein
MPPSRDSVSQFSGDEMRGIVLATAICVAFGITLGPAGSATRASDRACQSSSTDRALRLLRESVVRVEHRGGERVFVAAPINRSNTPSLMVGIAF